MSTSVTDRPATSAVEATEYRPTLYRAVMRYVVLLVGIFIAGVFIVIPLTSMNGSPQGYPWLVLVGFLMSDLCLYFFVAMGRVKLLVSPWGIEYYTLGMTMRAPWESVAGYSRVRSGYEMIDSLVVDRRAEMSGWMSGTMSAWPVLRPVMIMLGALSGRWWLLMQDMDTDLIPRSIPVGYFAGNLVDSPLGQQIKLYAPRAFDAVDRSALPSPAPAGEQQTTLPAPAARQNSKLLGATLWAALLMAQVLFAVLFASFLYRSQQPLLGASNALPGREWSAGNYGPLAMSRDGKTVAMDTTIKRFPEGNTVRTLEIPGSGQVDGPRAESVALSDDGSVAAVGGNDGQAYLWRIADGQLLTTISVTTPVPIYDSVLGWTNISWIYAVALSPDGKTLATVDPKALIKLWSVPGGAVQQTMKSAASLSRLGADAQLFFNADGQTLISRVEGTVELWRVSDGTLIGTADPGDWAENLSLSPDGKTMAIATLYGGLYIWDVANNKLLSTVLAPKEGDLHAGSMYGVALSPDGRTVLGGWSNGALQTWSLNGGPSQYFRDSSGTTVRWMRFTPDGTKVLYQKYDDNSLWLWDLAPAQVSGTPATPSALP